MTDVEQPTSPVETSPDTTNKESTIRTPENSPTGERQSDSAHGESVCSSPGNQTLLEQLSNELWKIVVSFLLLKNPTNDERGLPTELLSLLQQKKEAASALLAKSGAKASQLKKPATSNTISVPLPPGSSRGPFIRLMTRGKTTLIHLGQLVGILDDRSGFLMQRVISYDPSRVHLSVLSRLKPSEILHLTESKRQNQRAKGGSLLSRTIATGDGIEEEKRVAEVPCRFHQLTTSHGPVLTTPGLVLIRAEQVFEIGEISEDGNELSPLEWCKESKPIPAKQRQAPRRDKTPAREVDNKATSTSTPTNNMNPQSVNNANSVTEPGTPINRPKAPPDQPAPTESTDRQYLRNVLNDASVTNMLTSEQVDAAIVQMTKSKRPYRRRGGRRQSRMVSKQPSVNGVQNQPHNNQPKSTQTTQNVGPQAANSHPHYYESGTSMGCQYQHTDPGVYGGYAQTRRPRRPNYSFWRHVVRRPCGGFVHKGSRDVCCHY